MNTMTPLSRVLTVLKERGYTEDFNLTETCIICHGNSLQIYPQDFVVDKHYRFEGPSDPGDEAIVYAISSKKHNIKGVLVDGYGMYSDSLSNEMIQSLRENIDAYNKGQEFSHNNEADGSIKANQATELRPEGDRILNAELVEIDLNHYRRQIKEEQAWKNGDRNAITLFKSDEVRVVLIALHVGAELKTHTAPGTISVQVLEGEITFGTEQKTITLTTGQLITLQKEVPHSVFANKESTFLLTLSIPST